MQSKWSQQRYHRELRLESLEDRTLLAVVSLSPVKDNTLYEIADGSLSNGVGAHLFAGATGQPPGRTIRRGLVAFDIAGNVPAGATINSVTLTLNMSQTIAGPETISVHRVGADWGEGSSDADRGEGAGATATAGDATWLHGSFPGDLWATPGGVFSPAASAAAIVDQVGFYDWVSTPQLVADVGQWLLTPSTNFGWLLAGNESSTSTAKRFDSRENAVIANRPVLSIDYTETVVVPEISIEDADVAEGDIQTADIVFAVRLSEPADAPVTVIVNTAEVTATEGDDFVGLDPTTLSFAPGEIEKNVVVSILGDTTVESDETFQVILTGALGVTIADGIAVGTIRNDDAAALSILDVTLDEGDDGATLFEFTVALSNLSDFEVSVLVSTTDDTATAGTDYSPLFPTRVTFDPGETQRTVSVAVLGDRVVEADEAFTVNLSEAVGATIAAGTGTGRIVNDDEATLSIDDVTLTEGDIGSADFEFAVRLSSASDTVITVLVETAAGTATAGSDFVPLDELLLEFAPGETEKTVSVSVLGDDVVEDDEDFFVGLKGAVGAAIADDLGIGTILDDDATTLSVSDVALAEGDDGATLFEFVVRLSNASDSPVSVEVATADDTASQGSDYTALPPTLLEFLPGETQKQVTVSVIGDELVEGDETFLVVLTDPVGATIADDVGIGTILDDDATTLSIQDASIEEGDGGTRLLEFTVRLSHPSDSPVTASVATAGDSAIAGEDFEPVGQTTIEFSPGETVKSVFVSVIGDTLVEADETFFVNLSNAVGAMIDGGVAVGTILNDDLVALSIGDSLLPEGDQGSTLLEFIVRLSAASTLPVSVNVVSGDITATAGIDYIPLPATPLLFAPGEIEKTVTVAVTGDTVVERDEMFMVSLSGASGAVIVDSIGVGSIQNDDTATLTIEGVQMIEGDAATTPFPFTVRLSNPSDLPVSVEFSTVGITATAGVDFVPIDSQLLTFEPGGPLAMPLLVQVIGDLTAEPDEQFEAVLSAAIGATILTSRAEAIILDDDARPGSLAGFVFSDTNDNRRRDDHEIGIAGVTVDLSGVDFAGTAVQLTAVTTAGGFFTFANLMPGNYSVVETQPARYLDGRDGRGTPDTGPVTGVLHNDRVEGIELGSGVNISGIMFGERGLRPELINKSIFHSTTPVPESTVASVTAEESSDGWVRSLYRDLLERTAGEAEVAWWTEQINTGLSRRAVVEGFLGGTEYRAHAIGTLYQQYLDREVDDRGLSFWLDVWSSAGDGRLAVEAGILSSPEYYSAGGGDSTFIESLYEDVLGRGADTVEMNYWSETAESVSRSRIARRFLRSDERLLDDIAAWHQSYLNRRPTADGLQLALDTPIADNLSEQLQTTLLIGAEYFNRARV